MIKVLVNTSVKLEYSKNKSFLRKKIKKFISDHPFILTKAFWKNKKIFLKKWEEVNIDEKKRYKLNRLQSFFCWIDIIRKAKSIYRNDKNQFEISWLTKEWDIVIVHIREDKDDKKHNTYKFFVSSYISIK